MTLEGIIAARQREKEEARLKRDQEKEMEFRSEQREKVNILKTFFGSCSFCLKLEFMHVNKVC